MPISGSQQMVAAFAAHESVFPFDAVILMLFGFCCSLIEAEVNIFRRGVDKCVHSFVHAACGRVRSSIDMSLCLSCLHDANCICCLHAYATCLYITIHLVGMRDILLLAYTCLFSGLHVLSSVRLFSLIAWCVLGPRGKA